MADGLDGPGVIVDAHTHVACGDTVRFPRAASPGAGSHWWVDEGVDGEGLSGEMDAAGVGRAVVVQAVGAYGHDCACAASTVAARPDRLALVVSVDMDGPDPAGDLSALVASLVEGGAAAPSGASLAAPLRTSGVRLFGVGAATTEWLHDARADEVWEAAGRLGLTVVPCVFAGSLDTMGRVAADHPDVPVAVDHCGFPDLADDGWPAVLGLAAVPGIRMKVSSHVLGAAARDDGDPAVAVDRLVEAFGTERLCWGSDHPQDRSRPYAGKLALARRAARHLDPSARGRFFGGVADALWFAGSDSR